MASCHHLMIPSISFGMTRSPPRSSLSAPSGPIPWHWQRATQHPTGPTIPPCSSSIAVGSKTVLGIDTLWSVPLPGQQELEEVSRSWFLVRHHRESQLGLPERERKGHGSAWYSTSKDEVHVLCPVPHPRAPCSTYSTPQMSGRDCGQQLRKQRSLDLCFSLPSAEAARSSWAQAGELVLLHSRQR